MDWEMTFKSIILKNKEFAIIYYESFEDNM